MTLRLLTLIAGLMIASITPVFAQEGGPGAPAAAAANSPGRALVLSKCFQCHTDAMFRDQRQDRRAWEATAYRMVGRGALWTPDEIKLMADFLSTEFGPNAAPSVPR